MVRALGVRVPAQEAEPTRRRLIEMDVLRQDLKVARDGGDVVFPVLESCGPMLTTITHDFEPRDERAVRYADLLGWHEEEAVAVPRAFEHVGDIAVLKIPEELWPRRAEVGEALRRFRRVRAVFHDGGVVGPYRVRALERIAGDGPSATTIQESGMTLHIDMARAYFSPRLADERARVAAQVQPGERLVDLFGGVAPLGILAARAGALVDSVDINPDAVKLARENIVANGVAERVQVHEGDARVVAATLQPAHHVAMNLPHAAKDFLAVAAPLVLPGGLLHHHEILRDEDVEGAAAAIVAELRGHGRLAELAAMRHVRNYSAGTSHYALDFRLT
jgi:tRNA (guanine37-N1)-methyltransferase